MPGLIHLDPHFRGRIVHPTRENWSDIHGQRVGVMLHYDESSSDAGGVGWFRAEKCKVSYHWLVLDDGSYHEIAPFWRAAYHAGACRPSSPGLAYLHANSAFVGIAAAAASGDAVTAEQMLTIAFLTRVAFHRHAWPVTDTWRVTGHENEAWPRGRRSDPTGPEDQKPVLSLAGVRHLLGRIQLI